MIKEKQMISTEPWMDNNNKTTNELKPDGLEDVEIESCKSQQVAKNKTYLELI